MNDEEVEIEWMSTYIESRPTHFHMSLERGRLNSLVDGSNQVESDHSHYSTSRRCEHGDLWWRTSEQVSRWSVRGKRHGLDGLLLIYLVRLNRNTSVHQRVQLVNHRG